MEINMGWHENDYHDKWDNPRYVAAVEASIKANARKSRAKKFYANDERAQEITEFLAGSSYDNADSFLGKMETALNEYGSLTEGQRNAVVKIIDKRAALIAERQAADADCKWVGVVGERQAFSLTVQHVVALEGYYGTTYINICRDENNDIVVYKGSNGWSKKGTDVTCMAKIKEHGERDGIKQTIIQRPTKVKINGEDW
jgi:hypothetical protein